MILGDDGGASVSMDGGESWSSLYNQPTAELYHVTTDTREPYRIYAAQQDNTTIALPSHSRWGAITQLDITHVGGGESGYIAVRPDNPDIIFAGDYKGLITRHDQSTGESRPIMVWPDETAMAGEARYRFNWTRRSSCPRTTPASSTRQATASSGPPTKARRGNQSVPT